MVLSIDCTLDLTAIGIYRKCKKARRFGIQLNIDAKRTKNVLRTWNKVVLFPEPFLERISWLKNASVLLTIIQRHFLTSKQSYRVSIINRPAQKPRVWLLHFKYFIFNALQQCIAQHEEWYYQWVVRSPWGRICIQKKDNRARHKWPRLA